MKKQLLFLLLALVSLVATAQRKPIGNLLVESIPDIPTALKENGNNIKIFAVPVLRIGMLPVTVFILLRDLRMSLKFTTSIMPAAIENK